MKDFIGILFIIVVIVIFPIHIALDFFTSKEDITIKTDLQTVCKGTKVEFDDELFMVECQAVTCYVKKDKLVTCNTK